MSKAFTREENEGTDIPELAPVTSALPPGTTNYMTASGAERLRKELEQLIERDRPGLAAMAKTDPDAKRRLSILDQRVLQIEQSLGSARIVSHAPGPASRVTFGATVRVRDVKTGATSQYRIVGVDEAEAEMGSISWLSPLARSLINAIVGQRVEVMAPGGKTDLEIVTAIYD
jgi:transcription elongation factor GreB